MRRSFRRRRLSMTSLIDVIFLLLLFFMLTSTFSRFSEVELAVGGGNSGEANTVSPVFAQLGQDDLRINGRPITLEELPARLTELAPETAEASLPLLLSMSGGVTSQRLTDVLVMLRPLSQVTLTVLGET